jgi:hypothetical protein
MKKTILLISLLMTQLAIGQISSETITSETPLKTIMMTMAADLSKIEKQAGEPSQNKASEFLANEVSQFILFSKDVPPPKALETPEATEAFKAMIDGLSGAYTELAAAFKANENEKALEIIAQIKSIKTAGHGTFKKKFLGLF